MSVRGGIPTFVFRGDAYRVQVKVFDWSGTRWADQPTKFSVSVLPAAAKRSTAFSRGTRLYHGADVAVAWAIVLRYVSDSAPRLPAGLAVYARAA